MIMEHCKVTKMEAIKALREADGDKVNAILKLSDKWDFWINLFFILNEFKSLKLKKIIQYFQFTWLSFHGKYCFTLTISLWFFWFDIDRPTLI